jgi:hypothetical protein
MFENRRYVIVPATEINNINFDEVLETSAETCRYSVDGTLTFVKYEGAKPPSIPNYQEYTHDEIIEILSSKDWTTLNIE